MRLSLRYKAALFIAAAEAVLLGALVLTNLYQARSDLEHELKLHAHSTAELAAASATEALLSYDLAQLGNLLDGIVNKYHIRYAAIGDHRQRLLAEAGEKLEPAMAIEVVSPIMVAGTRFGDVTLQVTRAQTEASLATMTRSSLTIVMVSIFLVALISLTLGWLLTRRLGALTRGAEALGRGDLNARVPVQSQDEIGVLAARFNDMAARIQRDMDELAQGRRRFQDMADNTSDWLWETDLDGRYTFVSHKVEALLGHTPERLLGTSAFEAMDPTDAERLGALFKSLRQAQQPFYGFEYRAVRADGEDVMLEANGVPIRDERGTLIGYRGVTRDITRRKEDETRLIYLAEHDLLTGLLSRARFIEMLESEIALSQKSGLPVTLLFIDLNDFELVNDAYGHEAGDSLLRIAADMFKQLCGEANYIARLGGDEFGIMLRGGDGGQGETLARSILEALEGAQLAAAGHPVRLFASIGICTFPHGASDSQSLLAHADMAKSRARVLGHNRYHVYRSVDRDRDTVRQKINWRTLIQGAIQDSRLYLEFQPIVRVPTDARRRGTVSHNAADHYFEALVRLRGPDGVAHSAERFIQTAEHTGQIAEIDKWVLHKILTALDTQSLTECTIAMNVSGRSLGTPGFVEYVRERLLESRVNPKSLIFEVTESAAVLEMAKAENFISAMRKRGYRFSLDDFGVGFSSFSYLKHLPVDQIKIDGSFIRHLDTNRQDQIFVRAIVQVARELGLTTVAEFVETRSALTLLFDMDVDYVQGYYIGKPVSVLDIAEPDSSIPGNGSKKTDADGVHGISK